MAQHSRRPHSQLLASYLHVIRSHLLITCKYDRQNNSPFPCDGRFSWALWCCFYFVVLFLTVYQPISLEDYPGTLAAGHRLRDGLLVFGAPWPWVMAKEEEKEVGAEWFHQGHGRSRADSEEADQGRNEASGSDEGSQSSKPCWEICVREGVRCSPVSLLRGTPLPLCYAAPVSLLARAFQVGILGSRHLKSTPTLKCWE